MTRVMAGEMACAEVLAFEGGSAGLLGPVFRVPVTLVRPLGAAGEPSVAHSFPQLPMHEGTIQRRCAARHPPLNLSAQPGAGSPW